MSLTKLTFRILFTSAIAGLTSTTSFAFPAFVNQFSEHYSTNGIDTSKLVSEQSCALCHNSVGGGGPRNPYGETFRNDVLREGKGFEAIEFIDSDGDSFNNLEEIFLNTAPGLKADAPAARIGLSVSNGKVSISLPTTCGSFELISFGVKIDGANQLTKSNVSGVQTLAIDGTKGAVLVKCAVERTVGSLLLK
jgi:hypothetical protein